MPNSGWTERTDRVLRAVLLASRREAGLTQRQLAAKLERTQTFVAMVERGHRRLSVTEFIEIARALGVSPVTLLQRIERW